MLAVSLVTLGSPDQLTGGYLYHRRMAELAPRHDAHVDLVAVPALPFPLPAAVAGRAVGRAARADVLVVDSIAAAFVGPWSPFRHPRAGWRPSPRWPPWSTSHPAASITGGPGARSRPRSIG